MPAAAVFRDPDNNLLEFITVLPYPPRRDLGVLSWVDWVSREPLPPNSKGISSGVVRSHTAESDFAEAFAESQVVSRCGTEVRVEGENRL